jgi:carbohydrate diacid regulator
MAHRPNHGRSSWTTPKTLRKTPAEAGRRLEGVKPGVTLPVVLENSTVGTVGITGDADEVGRFGMVVKSQTEIMLRESLHLKIALLHERALESLLQDIANHDPAIVDPAVLVAWEEELGHPIVTR